ncbi:hypothetical protein, partial [Dermatophilus congolensis]
GQPSGVVFWGWVIRGFVGWWCCGRGGVFFPSAGKRSLNKPVRSKRFSRIFSNFTHFALS